MPRLGFSPRLIGRLLNSVRWRDNPLMGHASDADEFPDAPAAKSSGTSAEAKTEAMMAEYSTLRDEINRRANIQWNVVALQVTSVGVISSLAISSASHVALLLLLPLTSCVLGSRYILHDYHIKLIGDYISGSLSPRLDGAFKWESWKSDRVDADKKSRRYPAAARWRMIHPTRLAFEGVAMLALLAVIAAVAYVWRKNPPEWYLIVGFALLWCLGAVAAYSLHTSFDRSGDGKTASPFGKWIGRWLPRIRQRVR